MSQDPMEREEIEALLATRQELGPGMEPALVDSFANKIIAEVQRQTGAHNQVQKSPKKGSDGHLTLAIVSLVMAIPLTAIAMGASSWMVVVCWIGIVLVNFAYAARHRGQS
ncbi:MAG: hypothetical protein Q4P15_10085 [Propionibacteriaceae bacterium]|nr:hypothetical protein [Propionibacteriaceae bacterium]